VAWFMELAGSRDEFRAAIGAAGPSGVTAERTDDEDVSRLRELAADPRWHVHEGAAITLQRLGDIAPERMWSLGPPLGAR
jgi:hypothetical protein